MLLRRAVLSGLSAWSRRDLDLTLVRFAPDYQGEPPAELVGAGMRSSYRGHAGAREQAADLRGSFEQMDLTPLEIIDGGHRIVTLGHIRSRARGSGVELESRFGQALWVARGLVVRQCWFFDWDAALRAAGVPTTAVGSGDSQRVASDAIVRREIEPLHRSRRSVEERLVLAAPWLLRAGMSLAVRARPGSLVRRTTIGYAIRVAMASVNRGDYEAVLAGVSPEVEAMLLPDAPEARPSDAEPVYRGREDYVKLAEIWKADFENLCWELRELIDPGGDRIAARAERIGRGVRSGVEVRATDFFLWQFERGVLRRQWILDSEAAMPALLEGNQGLRSQATATHPPA